ncbi:MAG: Ig-like domain-containing protein [Oscillospiraceae bacterium]
MNRIKKIFAVVLAAALALVICVIPSSALTMEEEAKSLKSGSTYKGTFEYQKNYYYKIDVTKKGNIEWKISFEAYEFQLYIYDDFGKEIKFTSKYGNGSNEYSGVLEGSFEVEPGRYYIQLRKDGFFGDKGSGDTKFKISYPSSSSKEVSSANSQNTSIAVYIDKGDKIQLGGFISGKEAASITWTSSDGKVAKVNSKGKVTGVSAGKAVITGKSGKTTVSIVIIVED